MAIRDILAQVSTAQVLGTGATLSSGSIPMGAAVRLDDVEFEVNVSGVSGTSPTLTVEIVGADDGALTSNVVALGRIDPTVATGQAAKNYFVDASIMTKKAFVGLRYTMGGTTPAATVTSAAIAYVDGKQRDYSVS